MPILVYSASRRRLKRVEAALKGRRIEVFTGERSAFVFGEARCLVWVLGRAELDMTVKKLAIVTRRHPQVPVIVVSDDQAKAAIALSSIPLHAVLAVENLEVRLPHIVREAIAQSWFEQIAREAATSGVRPLLAEALVLAIRAGARTPFRNPSELARDVGCCPDTLARALREAVHGRYRLTGLLSAIQVVRARILRGAGSSWSAAAPAVNCHYESLRIKAKRWPGRSLRQLALTEPEQLLRSFEAEFISVLGRSVAEEERSA